MKNQDNTEEGLVRELESLRARVAELEESEARLKETERLLRESEERFAFALDAAALGFWEWNLTTGKVVRDYHMLERLGYSPGEIDLDIKTWKQLVHPQDWPLISKTLNDRLAGDLPIYEAEYRTRTRAGDWLWILERGKVVERASDGRPVRLIGISLDITDRKKAEQSLRDIDERLRLSWATIPDAVSITRMEDGNFVDVNDGFTVFTGYSQGEVLGRLSVDVPLWHDPASRERFVSHLQRDGYVKNFEAKMQRKDGKLRTFLLSARRITHNEEPHILTVGKDVEDLCQAMEALRVSEETYRRIFEHSIAGIFQTTPDGRWLTANPAIAKLLGYASPEEIINEVTDIGSQIYVRLEDREECTRHLKDLSAVEGYEFELRRKDGTHIWVSMNAHAVRDERSEVLYYEGTLEDITDRKKAQNDLRESEERYRILFNDSKDAVYITRRDGELRDCNQAFFDLLGFTREQIVGRDIRTIYVNPSDREEFVEAIEARGFLKDYPLTFRRKDGKGIDCFLTSSLRRATDGTILGYHGIVRDITEQRNLQKQLLQAQKMEAVGTLAGGIAHDFNNLLQVMLGYSELLLAEKDKEHPDYADLKKIFLAAQSGSELVQQLLMFSRKSEAKPVAMNLNEQIAQIEKLLRRTIPKMIAIRLEFSSDLPKISADPSQIEQVLMNLALNARDAMGDAGTLTVKTKFVTLDEEYRRLHVDANPGEYVLLEVSDTGSGMDKETVEHIFEPFFTTKQMRRGTGLGLAMVYGIVTQHKGHITVTSEVGKGTTFRVYLPTTTPDVQPEVGTSGEMPAFGSETVLLVDDEAFVRELGARILMKHGYTVLQAEDGRNAFKLFKRERSQISLVILDLVMPEMGGTECLRELLKIDPEVKVIVASGLSADVSVQETIDLGAKGFVSKPFRVKELLRDVRKVLDET